MNDKRIGEVLKILGEYAKGNFNVEIPAPANKDEIDKIFLLLSKLRSFAQQSPESNLVQRTRINKMMDVIVKYATFDFSEKLEISSYLDNLDAIAAGLNTLGEELEDKINELQKNNEELKKLAIILETTADAVATITPEGFLVSWNKSAERIYGYNEKEMLGRRPDEILASGESRDAFIEILKRVKKGEQISDFHTKRRRKDGVIIDVSVTLTPIFNDQKKLISISAISREITAQKLAEQHLRESEERFRLLVESVKDYAIFRIDPNGKISSWNKGAQFMTGFSEAEILGKHVSVFYTVESVKKNEPEENLKIALEKGIHRGIDWKVKKDGSLFYAEAVCTPFFDDKGMLKGYSKVMQDITDKKIAEDLMGEQREQIETIIGNAPSAVIVIDEKGNIIRWNAKAEQIFGWTLNEVLNKPMHEFIMPERFVAAHYQGIHHFLKTGHGPVINKVIEIAAVRKNKEEFPIELGISAVRSRGKYIFIAFITDITERKKNEEQLKTAYEALDLSNKELEAFTYSVSHDLRAPIRAIHSYTDILSKQLSEVLNEDNRRIMNSVQRNTSKMSQLINDLLELSHLGQKELQREKVDMDKVVNTVLEGMKHLSAFKKVNFKISPLPEAHADYNLMVQVFQNLISNAVKYSSLKENPEVEIGSTNEGLNTVYYVKDNGAGFDMKYYNKLFGVFQRLHSQEEFEGTGVGLTIVKRVIDKHHGKVWAESEPGKGAAFYFYIK